MRNLFLISVVGLTINIQAFSQIVISVICDDSWGPGRYNKVTCIINIANSAGFARFSQDFPVGFEIAVDKPGSGDFSWINNQLNVVWMKLPESRILTFSYFIKPERSMNGSFTMSGRFINVSGSTKRQITLMKEKTISIEGTNGIFPEQMKAGSGTKTEFRIIKKPENQTIAQKDEIKFRVQVSVSSTRITEEELIKRLGLGKDIGMKIIQSGKMFKYQVGNFTSYESANKLLKQIIARGNKDAFIVAYSGTEQIPVEKALNPSK